ncbi:MAG: hypothetical protein GX824_02365 [Clostridiales bacterium]|jgi:uncharacterized alpha/beta hydrolase family protein|nr:hypothetical protein [Clostridiales bacterium]
MMKKIITILLVFLLCVFIAIISCSNIVKTYRKNHSNTNESTALQILYILKEYDGRVALYNMKEEEEPIEVYDVYTDSLPYDDYLLIKNGIKIESEAELQKIIEEYLS